MARQVALYRLFDRAGGLLYIGITNNVAARFNAHRHHSTWWSLVDENATQIEWFPYRHAAAQAETEAIAAAQPPHNRVGVADKRPPLLGPVLPPAKRSIAAKPPKIRTSPARQPSLRRTVKTSQPKRPVGRPPLSWQEHIDRVRFKYGLPPRGQ